MAVPTPADGRGRLPGEPDATNTAEAIAYTTYVDARTGGVLIREDLVDFDSDNPTWAVFPAAPPASVEAHRDPRDIWCLDPVHRAVTVRSGPGRPGGPGTSTSPPAPRP